MQLLIRKEEIVLLKTTKQSFLENKELKNILSYSTQQTLHYTSKDDHNKQYVQSFSFSDPNHHGNKNFWK
jgi:hypothetical protein